MGPFSLMSSGHNQGPESTQGSPQRLLGVTIVHLEAREGPTHLHALKEQCHDVAAGYQLLHMPAQALSQAAEQVQRHDHEVLVRGLVLLRVLGVHLGTEGGRQVRGVGPGWGSSRGAGDGVVLEGCSPWPGPASSAPG